MSIGNNLYPPIIDTYMPSFVRTSPCRIYFSLSSYNTIEDIKNAQVIVKYQNNNMSALKSNLYPAEIMITNIYLDSSVDGDKKYYVVLNPSDLVSGIFEVNQFYKIQIRFTSIKASNVDTSRIAAWLVNNQQYFSEWSTVCLIKGIEQPRINIKGFETASSSDDTIVMSQFTDIVGSMYYNGYTLEKEYLKYYQIQIQDNGNGKLIYDSGEVYTNEYNPNEINYTLKYNLESGVSYKFIFYYTTNNGYSNKETYLFTIISRGIDVLEARIETSIDEENGRIEVQLVATNLVPFLGNITIRRTSNESNFTIWEDVHTTPIQSNQPLNYTWYDYTVESGIWYKYCAQRRNSRGDRGSIIETRNPVMLIMDHIYLTRADIQLKIKYDPNISSFQRTLLESKTDTLGSKYPYIVRNGNVEYRQFPISGLITAFSDEDGLFLNKDILYKESKEDYEDYNNINGITEYNDFAYEKKFRDRIMDFLYENNIKLFRSATEGNILVKLMDISFTPNQTLGRMLYSFSATAYEIDECSLDNYNKYGIQIIGNYSSHLVFNYKKMGQLQGVFSTQNIISILQNKYITNVNEGYKNNVSAISWMRLEFNSDPYLIKTLPDGTMMPLGISEVKDENTVYGYIAYINNQQILVSSRRYYELADNDTLVNSIWFPVDTDITLDYTIDIEQTEDTSKLVSRIYYYTKVSQMQEVFNFEESVSHKIYLKHLENYPSYYQQVVSINELTIEAIPGTIIYLKDSTDDAYHRHIIGNTGILHFYDNEAVITGFLFSGVHLNEVEDSSRETMDDTHYINTNVSASTFNEIKNPIKNGVYKIEEKRYIYYDSKWYLFNEDDDIECDTFATVDYIYDLMRGEY